MADVDLVFEIETRALAEILDELDYFQILKIEPTASADEIKRAYFRESRSYHPDRFFRLPDQDFKLAVSRIYKRINEAYVCLRDDRMRAKYQQDIAGADRALKLRFTDASEEELKRARDAEFGATPQARRLFQQAMLDMEAGRHAQAVQSLRMCLAFEPANTLFKERLEEATRAAGGK